MGELAIKAENLSKRYFIGASKRRNDTLRDQMTDIFAAPFRRVGRLIGGGSVSAAELDESFWALQDVSFELRQGEVLGIIGRNGAGKSTLLKVLSRIVEPTRGHVDVYGRVGSLLEVGTGFHPELTGRENIFLNGAILGMGKEEIEAKYDEIVSFSEIEKFLETPVKHYSSGMYVRLAFAVAAHLEPEILLVDEVLAVGDAAFQKKCMGKMDNVAQEGRTVVFVSHNMGAINSLTEKCLYLDTGKVTDFGITEKVVERYLSDILQHRKDFISNLDYYRRNSDEDPPIKFTDIRVNQNRSEIPTIQMESGCKLEFIFDVNKPINGANLTVVLKNSMGDRIVVLFSWDHNFYLNFRPGTVKVSLNIPSLPLTPGLYLADFGINKSTNTEAYDVILDFPLLRVSSEGVVHHWLDRSWGNTHWGDIEWDVVEEIHECQ